MEIKRIINNKLIPDKEQPRKLENYETEEFSESLKNEDIENPLIVEDLQDSYYLIVDGHRRYQAGINAGKTEFLCKVKNTMTDLERAKLRYNLNKHTKKWEGYERDELIKQVFKSSGPDATYQSVADFLSEKVTTVKDAFDRLGLLEEHPEFKDLSPSTITETRGLDDEERITLLKKAKDEDIGSRAIRQEVKQIKERKKRESIKEELNEFEEPDFNLDMIKSGLIEEYNEIVKSIPRIESFIEITEGLIIRNVILNGKVSELINLLIEDFRPLLQKLEVLQNEI